MDYNEYNSNGNKRKYNVSDLLKDKTQRSRLMLLVYIIIFIFLIVFIRLNLSKSLTNNNEENNIINEEQTNTSSNTEINDVDLDEINKMFSFIDTKNYNFVYEIKMNSTTAFIEGKRFENKLNFELKSNDSVLYFKGTEGYIKACDTVDGEYKVAILPYVFVDVFNNNLLKDIIKNSTFKDDKYIITNKELAKIVKYDKITNEDAINSIELIKNNNIVTKIVLDLSNSVSSYLNENTNAIFTLNYSNFGLIDNFNVE